MFSFKNSNFIFNECVLIINCSICCWLNTKINAFLTSAVLMILTKPFVQLYSWHKYVKKSLKKTFLFATFSSSKWPWGPFWTFILTAYLIFSRLCVCPLKKLPIISYKNRHFFWSHYYTIWWNLRDFFFNSTNFFGGHIT